MNKELKTTFGLGKAHCAKNVFERESEKRRLGLRENQGFLVGDHPHLWFPSDQGGRRKVGQRVQRDYKV